MKSQTSDDDDDADVQGLYTTQLVHNTFRWVYIIMEKAKHEERALSWM